VLSAVRLLVGSSRPCGASLSRRAVRVLVPVKLLGGLVSFTKIDTTSYLVNESLVSLLNTLSVSALQNWPSGTSPRPFPRTPNTTDFVNLIFRSNGEVLSALN